MPKINKNKTQPIKFIGYRFQKTKKPLRENNKINIGRKNNKKYQNTPKQTKEITISKMYFNKINKQKPQKHPNTITRQTLLQKFFQKVPKLES